MSLDADTIVDRRRMRRKLTFWRVLAVLIGIGAIVAISAVLRVPGTGILTGQAGPAIARVSITGLIRSDQERVEALDKLPDPQRIALVMHHVLGMTVTEIASELASPPETIRSRLRVGMGQVRALLGALREGEA